MAFPVPDWAVYILLAFSWLAVAYAFWFKPVVVPKFDAYFYKRRAQRRIRNYNSQPKKVTQRARARHRR